MDKTAQPRPSTSVNKSLAKAKRIDLPELSIYPLDGRVCLLNGTEIKLTPTEMEFLVQLLSRSGLDRISWRDIKLWGKPITNGYFRNLKSKLFEKFRSTGAELEKIIGRAPVSGNDQEETAVKILVTPHPVFELPSSSALPPDSLLVFSAASRRAGNFYPHSFARYYGHFSIEQGQGHVIWAQEDRTDLIPLHPERRTLLIQLKRQREMEPWSYWKAAIAVRTTRRGEWIATDVTPYSYLMIKARVYRDDPDDPVPLLFEIQLRLEDDTVVSAKSIYNRTTPYLLSSPKIVTKGYKSLYFELSKSELWLSAGNVEHELGGMRLPFADRTRVTQIVLENLDVPTGEPHLTIEISEIAFVKAKIE